MTLSLNWGSGWWSRASKAFRDLNWALRDLLLLESTRGTSNLWLCISLVTKRRARDLRLLLECLQTFNQRLFVTKMGPKGICCCNLWLYMIRVTKEGARYLRLLLEWHSIKGFLWPKGIPEGFAAVTFDFIGSWSPKREQGICCYTWNLNQRQNATRHSIKGFSWPKLG